MNNTGWKTTVLYRKIGAHLTDNVLIRSSDVIVNLPAC